MAGDQQDMLYAWDWPEHWHGIARQGPQTHTDVANLGLGETWRHAQRFAEHFLDAGRGSLWVKAGAGFPGGANRDATVRPGDHIVTAEGTDHGPCGRVSPWQTQMDDLPALRCHRDLNTKLCPKSLGPGATRNHDCTG